MRERNITFVTILLFGVALFDVFTAWQILPHVAAAVCLIAGTAVAILWGRKLRLAFISLVTLCFALHVGFALGERYERDRWESLRKAKAEKAIAHAASILDARFTEVSDKAAEISALEGLAGSLQGGAQREAFAILEAAASSIDWKDDYGIAVTGSDGRVFAWAGRLPDYVGERSPVGSHPAVAIRRSTTHYWIEGRGSPGAADADGGRVIVFRQLDAIYPGVLPRTAGPTLSEQLTAGVDHEVTVTIGESVAGGRIPQWRDRGRVVSSVMLPDGTPVGELVVKSRAFGEESDILRNQGLFLAALAVLALIGLACYVTGRRFVGYRFRHVSAGKLAAVLLALAAARYGFSLLRQLLNLDVFDAFTSVHYATQIPTGILRSPADLAITGVFGCGGACLVLLANAYRPSSSERRRGSTGHDALPVMVLGFIAGAMASAVILLAGYVYQRLFADSAIVLLTASPFDLSASHVVMRIGIFAVSAAVVLIGGALIQWQMALIRSSSGASAPERRPWVLSGLTIFVLAAVFAVAGVSPFVFVTATICFLFGLLLDLVYRKKVGIGMVSVVTGLALVAAVLQFPFAVRDYEAKQRESIEAVSGRIEAQTDAWKLAVLEDAVARVAEQGRIVEALAGGAGLDAFALSLWANSILSRANVVSGIHVLDSDHEVIGKFSLGDIGDLSEIEGALRSARFSAEPVTILTRGALAGSDIDLYVGMIPVLKDGTYLGSIVISIPVAYADLRSMAGLRPAFLEAFTIGNAYDALLEGDYSASLVSEGRVVSTTARDFEVGPRIATLDGGSLPEAGWIDHRVARTTYSSYLVPLKDRSESLLLSLRLPSASDLAVHFMGLLVSNLIIAFFIILIGGLTKGSRRAIRVSRGMGVTKLRWSFASKLALGFVLIAIVPTLILGTTSRGFLRVRLREIMESKAEEGLNLSKLALERLVGGEAVRLARNPILIDELTEEPSILGMLVSHDVSAAVFNSGGVPLAAYGDPQVPGSVLSSVLRDGRSYNFFSVDGGLYAKSAVPVRDIVSPDRIKGCAFVSRRIDDALAHQLSSELGRDISFFGSSDVAASSKREMFVSELMASKISPDAYLECFASGREVHFTWERIGGIDLVIGFSPLRGFDGTTAGAISVPVLFRKDDVGRRMEWTSAAISYILVIVIGSIFILGLILAGRISRPIRDLIHGTLRIGSGDLRFTIPKSGDDEIGDLVSSFNKMTGALSKSRKALSERKQYIETIIGNVGAGIISTDWRGRIDTLNSAAEKLLGVKGRNARGRDAGGLLRKIGAPDLAAILDELEGEQGLARKEVSLTQSNGRPLTLRAVASVVRGPKGKRMGKVIVFEDVTELIRSKQLIAWSEMARQVAHEIKNPLTPMKLSAQQLLQSHRDSAGDFDRVLEDSVATIIEQIESLRRIAVEFSQFSRMPERKIEPTDINTVLEESLTQYERTIGSTMAITKDLHRSIPRLKIDRDELKRVFLNIIENAVQAMPEGGSLQVESGRRREPERRRRYDFSASSRDAYADPIRNYVELSFTDTGTGIAPRDSDKLFEPNFSTKTHGSGLGLAICKGIIDGYGGEIVIESTPGVGTCVRIRLPLPDEPIRRGRPRRRYSRKSHRPRPR